MVAGPGAIFTKAALFCHLGLVPGAGALDGPADGQSCVLSVVPEGLPRASEYGQNAFKAVVRQIPCDFPQGCVSKSIVDILQTPSINKPILPSLPPGKVPRHPLSNW